MTKRKECRIQGVREREDLQRSDLQGERKGGRKAEREKGEEWGSVMGINDDEDERK